MPGELDTAYAILRAAFGVMIFVHGYRKAFQGGGLGGTARWFHSMGMRPGRLHAFMAAYTEMVTGVMLVLGMVTQIAAASLIGLMVVAFWTVHRDKGFIIINEGWEYVAIIAITGLVVAMVGPGDVSLDAVLDVEGRVGGWIGVQGLDGWVGMWIALGLGIGSGVGFLLFFYRPSLADSADAAGDAASGEDASS